MQVDPQKNIKELKEGPYPADSISFDGMHLSFSDIVELCEELNKDSQRHVINLSLRLNDIIDVSPLCNLKYIQTIDLAHNNITDISALKSLKNIKSLNLSHNKIADTHALTTLTDLEHLDLSNNPIKEYTPNKKLSSLVLPYFLGETNVNLLAESNHLVSLQLISNDDEINVDPSDDAIIEKIIRKNKLFNEKMRITKSSSLTQLFSINKRDETKPNPRGIRVSLI